MRQAYRLIKFTIDSCTFPRVLDIGGGRIAVLACQCDEGNLNSIMYVVTVKTDADTVVSHLLRKILTASSLFLCQSYICVPCQRQQLSISSSTTRRLEILCTYIEELMNEVRASQLAQASERVGSLIPASQQG